MKNLSRILFVLAFIATMTTLTSCQTTEGFKQDVHRVLTPDEND